MTGLHALARQSTVSLNSLTLTAYAGIASMQASPECQAESSHSDCRSKLPRGPARFCVP